MSVLSPISPVLDQLADLAQWDAQVSSDPVLLASSLVGRLSQVPDQRKRRGLRHSLLVVLALSACATLVVGGDSVAAIWQWAARASQDVLETIGARRDPWLGLFLVPSERTFRRVLQGLDADALDLTTCGYAMDVVRGAAPVPVIPRTPGPAEREERRAAQRSVDHPLPAGLLPAAAVDGKAARGARTATGPVFLVGAIAHVSGVILGQRQVPGKKGEGAQVGPLLAPLDAAGMVFTLDALHTTKKTARLITEDLHAHYLLILKGNQPLARAAAHALLSGTDAEFEETSAAWNDRGHGRRERRTIRTAPPIPGCSPVPARSSACAGTSANRTARGPVKKSSWASPACPRTSQGPNTSTATRDTTGPWKTDCTGSATSLSTRITLSSEPVQRPEPSPVSETWLSTPSASQAAPTSPTPAATCSTTTTPSPHSASDLAL